jgi:short-subunit dehydrogenase
VPPMPSHMCKKSANSVDVVIANAGVGKCHHTVVTLRATDLEDHILVNAVGTVYLFQEVLPLFSVAQKPKFVVVSSSAALIGDMENRNIPNVRLR